MAAQNIPLTYNFYPPEGDSLIYCGSISSPEIYHHVQILSQRRIGIWTWRPRFRSASALRPGSEKSRDPEWMKTEKRYSLYAAMDVASVWLVRALANP